MTIPIISVTSFVKAMALPDDQRREQLECLGAKMMDRFRSEQETARAPAQHGDLGVEQA